MTGTISREKGETPMDAQQEVQTQTMVREGTWTPVTPSQGFACVEDDLSFTGSASLCKEPYFSQLENFGYGPLIGGVYWPSPVYERHVLIFVAKVEVDPAHYLVAGSVPLHTAVHPDSGPHAVITQPATAVKELSVQMRDLVDLPVQDLARMCGLRRRQYYNVMSGEAASTRSEQLMRLLHAELTTLWQELDNDPALVRSAVLTPLDAFDYATFFDVAVEGDTGKLRSAFAKLRDQLEHSVPARNALPPSGTFPKGDPRWEGAHEYMDADKRGR